MHLTRFTSAKKVGFRPKRLHRQKERPKQTASYLKQKSSFFMAALSLVAFVTGNMAADHGWYAFWKAVLGNADDALITYTGTVGPVEFVPDYDLWSTYGGDSEQHTFRQVPKSALIPLPIYDQPAVKKGLDATDVYSVGNMGSYKSGAEGEGSHPGVDIRVPVGTPVRAIASGIVTQVSEDSGGYGFFIVIRHPHMPDPDRPSHETVLHSAYAHLSAQLVRVGDLVEKGQQIGLSGQSGFVTGPHLHFQVDRDEAPWHPYWPFTGSEARAASLTMTQAVNSGFHQERLKEYTVHPMLLVQANLRAPTYAATDSGPKKTSVARTREQIHDARTARRNVRIARRVEETPPTVTPTVFDPGVLAIAAPIVPPMDDAPAHGKVASFDIASPRQFNAREWITLKITLLDENGKKTSAEYLEKDVYLRTAYGEAEFKPAILGKEDFVNGVATVEMLPRGRRTVVILLQPYAFQSGPMEYKE